MSHEENPCNRRSVEEPTISISRETNDWNTRALQYAAEQRKKQSEPTLNVSRETLEWNYRALQYANLTLK